MTVAGRLMRKFALASLIALCGCAVPPAPVRSDGLTLIASIRSDPWASDGRTFLVRGTFDECISFTCTICDTEAGLRRNSDEKRGCAGVSFKQGRTDEDRIRFSTSIIRAPYDARCSRVQDPKGPPDQIVLCTDRASEFDDAEIVQIEVVRPATEGHISAYGLNPLRAPDKSERALLLEAYKRKFDSELDASNPSRVFVYVVVEDEDRDRSLDEIYPPTAGVCVCKTDHCATSDWPKREGDTFFDSPANPYLCETARKKNGDWVF